MGLNILLKDNTRACNLSLGPPVPVLGGRNDRAESVCRDAEYCVDRAQASRVIDGEPQITEYLAEGPMLIVEQVDRIKRHRNASDQ